MSEPIAPAPTVWPSFRARDARALIDFLVEAFGFEERVVHETDDGLVQHAELRWPEGGGIMLGSSRDDNPDITAPGGSSAYVVTDRIDELYARALAAGATMTRDLHDTDYGSRDFAARDIEGNLWSFGTYRGHPA